MKQEMNEKVGMMKEHSPLHKALSVEDKPEKTGFEGLLVRQGIEISFQRYAIDAFGAMALGLFASLLIGTIISTLGNLFPAGNNVGQSLVEIGGTAMKATGAAMAMAIGHALHAPVLVLFSLASVGMAANSLGGAGGPLAVFVVALVATECGKLVSKTTPVDIIVTPFVTTVVGVGLAMLTAPAIGAAAAQVGEAVNWATTVQPFLMGIIVSVLMGIALTLPISSAAIAASLGLTGLAGGAALAGCCAQMVGFAVMSWPENKWPGLLSQGLGTSMLQMPNITKKPLLFLPPIIASAITGPIATTVFHLEMNGPPLASGMGTSGMVGVIGVVTGWSAPSAIALERGASVMQAGSWDILGLVLISIVLPAVLTYLISAYFRRKSWIEYGDLTLDLG